MSALLFLPGFAADERIWELQRPKFDPQGFFVVGWSLGGQEAVRLAATSPEKFKGLILVSSFGKFLKSPDNPTGLSPALLRNLEKKLQADLSAGLEFFYQLMFTDGAVHPQINKMGHPSPAVIAKQLEMLKSADVRPLLPRIKVPTLIIQGDKDQICLPGTAIALQEKIPNSRLRMMKGVGHAPFLEAPEIFFDLLSDFIKQHDQP